MTTTTDIGAGATTPRQCPNPDQTPSSKPPSPIPRVGALPYSSNAVAAAAAAADYDNNKHDEKYFTDLLANVRTETIAKLPPVSDTLRTSFHSLCSSVVSSRAARDAASNAKDATDRAKDATDDARKTAKEALDAAEEALLRAEEAATRCAVPILDGLRDALLESDEFDANLSKGAVLFQGTASGLASFCAGGNEQDRLVMCLLEDVGLMRRMLEAGGAKGGRYGQAAQIYRRIKDSDVDREWIWVCADGSDGEGDDDDDVLERLALGTSLEHAVPIAKFHSEDKSFLDPVARYKHYADAYRRGDELDETFANRTAWEMRLVSNSDAPDDQLLWGREMLRNYRPDLVRLKDTKWRYCNIVHTDVGYRHPDFEEKTYPDIISGGGECGPRAWFGRYACRCFGIPVWGCKQPGHAAMTHWTPDQGWVVCLIYGGFWEIAWWEDRCGNDFLLETQARESGGKYMAVLRLEWVADLLGEKELDHMKVMVHPDSFWRSLALCQKKILAAATKPPSIYSPKNTIETGISYVDESTTTEKYRVAHRTNDGTIVIAATSCTRPQGPTPDVLFLDSYSGGTQLHHSNDATVEYDIEISPSLSSSLSSSLSGDAVAAAADGQTYAVTFRVCNVHSKQSPILLTVTTKTTEDLDNDGKGALATAVSIEVPYTAGAWAQTDPVQVELVMGKTNVISFTRHVPNFGLSIKYITLSANADRNR